MAGFENDFQHVLYDLTPDDQRFVMLRRGTQTKTGQLIRVQNWFEELKAKVGK